MRFYFNDFENHLSAPQSFVNFIITKLESSLFDIGDLIVKGNTWIKDLIFMINGDTELNSYIDIQFIKEEVSEAIEAGCYVDTEERKKNGNLYETRRVKVPVVTLKEGSWFGDYPIMAIQKTKFELRAMSKLNK